MQHLNGSILPEWRPNFWPSLYHPPPLCCPWTRHCCHLHRLPPPPPLCWALQTQQLCKDNIHLLFLPLLILLSCYSSYSCHFYASPSLASTLYPIISRTLNHHFGSHGTKGEMLCHTLGQQPAKNTLKAVAHCNPVWEGVCVRSWEREGRPGTWAHL